MLNRTGVAGSFAAMLLVFISHMAHAGIKEFNAAMSVGDYAAAAAETKGVWQNFDKTKASATTIAREFAFVNYLAGNYDAAKEFVDHLVADDGMLLAQDEQPDVSRVLSDLIACQLDPGSRQRVNLRESLEQRLAEPDVDNISMVAAEFLYPRNLAEGQLAEAELAADIAAELFRRIGDAEIASQRKAELAGAVAKFMRDPEPGDYETLVELHNLIVADVDKFTDQNQFDDLVKLKWTANAWVNSVEAWFASFYSQTGSHIDRNIKSLPLASSEHGYFYESVESSGPGPLCDAYVDSRRLRYPVSAGFVGLIGSVILKLDFNDEGEGANPVILAAIPDAIFADAVLEAVPDMRLKPKKDEDPGTCRLSRANVVVPFTFVKQKQQIQ